MSEETTAVNTSTESAPAATEVKREPFAALSETQTETVQTTTPPITEEVNTDIAPTVAGEKKEGEEGYVKPAETKTVEATAPTTEQLTGFKFADQLELGKDVTFQTLATEYGFEVKENTPTAFNEGLKTFLEAEKAKASESSFMAQLEKEPADVQEAYLLKKNGISLSEIEQPTQEIDSLLGLSDFDLAKAELDTTNLSAQLKEAELLRLSESGEIGGFTANIRNGLNIRKQEISEWRVNNFQKLLTKEKTRQEAENTQRLTSIATELKNTTEFLGIPLTDDVKKGFEQRLQSGKYNDMMNSPKAIAMAILQHEMSQYAVNELKQKAIAPIIEKQIKESHNIPPHVNTGSVIQPNSATKPFGALTTG